jgi:hypothetical protein
MKPVIYQIVVRYFGNTNTTNQHDGSIEANGCGKFADITETALQALKDLGVTHVWRDYFTCAGITLAIQQIVWTNSRR